MDLRPNQQTAKVMEHQSIHEQAMNESKLDLLGPPPYKTAIGEKTLSQLIMNFSQEAFKSYTSTLKVHSPQPERPYVLQRIFGHPEIDCYDKPGCSRMHLKMQIEDAFSKQQPKHGDLDQVAMNKHLSRWFISENCWICDYHRYFVPLFLKSEIKDANMELTPELDRQLKKLILNQGGSQGLDKDHPYIIGSITNGRLLRMKNVIELLLKLDINGKQLIEKFKGDDRKIQDHYKS